MKRESGSFIAPLLKRLVPESLGGRLIVFVVLLALTTTLATIVIREVSAPAASSAAQIAQERRADIVSIALSGAVALMIGVGLGIWLTDLMRTPVTRMVEHVRTHGYLAAEGAPYAGDELLDDPALPREYRELMAVVEDLLQHLTARQSELKTAVRTAQSAEETLGIVVNESLEGKLVLRDGRILMANPAAGEALGLDSAELVDLTASSALSRSEISDEDGAPISPSELVERALDAPLTVQLWRGQDPRWFTVQATRHADDLHNRILLTMRDVTEERRLDAMRAEIVSLVSHDLRSPLAVVIGYLDLLRQPLTDDNRERAVSAAKRNASRMADLLEDLLSATRAEELLAPSELVPVQLDELVQEVISSMGPTHAERRLTFESHGSPLVLGEEKRLRQVIVNLVTNAFKYTPEDSPIRVTLEGGEHSARLSVIDRGDGIPQEERERIFERFARLGNDRSRSGIGLGLYIVRIICQNHGGSVRVEETPGGGCTFVVELPLADAAPDESQGTLRASAADVEREALRSTGSDAA